MGTPGDFYAVALHDARLRAGLIATDRKERRRRPALTPRLRTALAAGLRALAAAVDARGPTVPADRRLAALR
jgi:hypothetical protein